jgi:inhibitor of KinA
VSNKLKRSFYKGRFYLFVFSLFMQHFKFIAINESSLLISFGDVIHEEVNTHVMQAKAAIEANPFPGFVETVPAYTSLAVYYNPEEVKQTRETLSATVIETLEILLASATAIQATTKNNIIELPVCYDIEFAADLIEIAEHLQLTTEELINIHHTKTYKVFMLGFTPGFPYMGTVDERIFTQRKQQPRLKIEPGSVAIAGHQTGIYPFATPGGWNIIGRTPLLLLDRNRSNPFLLKAGDEVKFKQISKEEFYKTPSAAESPDGGSTEK